MNIILSIILAVAVNGSLIDPNEMLNWEVQCAEPMMIGNVPVLKVCFQNPDREAPVQQAIAILAETPRGIVIVAYAYLKDGIIYGFHLKNGVFVPTNNTPI